jgi:hypothetical protein
MSGAELQVIPEDLAGKANRIRGMSWITMTAQPPLVAPDALSTSAVAITNLTVNTEAMWAYQEFGRLEGLRLAQTLDNVSAAYADVDKISGEDVDRTISGPGSPAAPNGSRYPKDVDLPAPPHPPQMPIPKGRLVSEQMLFPPQAQQALQAGDGGSSLQAAAESWRRNAHRLAASAEQFETNSLLWEGEAADAAYTKFNNYRGWLVSLASSWQRLAGEADRIVAAHSAAKRDNAPVAEDFDRLQREIAEHPASADNLRKTLQMAALQNQSEEIRNRYARDGQPRQIQPEDPPSPVVSGIPVTVDDHRRARRTLPTERPSQASRLPAAPNGGSSAGGEPQGRAEQPAVSPMPGAQHAAQGAPQGSPQGNAPSAGQQGGVAPSAGQQGARQPLTGMPTSPKLPTDARMRPAAAGSGGSGGSSAVGGVPGSPLQPAVGAETVAATPLPAPVVPTSATGGGAAGGLAGGGMGGMAPLMHGARSDGSGDKKRNPQLSQDNEVYTEDRPWTEAVIGNRVRRRNPPEDRKKEPQ